MEVTYKAKLYVWFRKALLNHAEIHKHSSLTMTILLNRRLKPRGSEPSEKPNAAGKRKGSPKGPAALKKLVVFLLPLAGKRILVMLALAIARTALSNRLARVQVGSQADARV